MTRVQLLGNLALVGALACGVHYSFRAGGFPPRIKTMAVLQFENKTTSPELPQELFDVMRTELRGRMGLRDAPQDKANAIVRGTIQQFQEDMPVGVSADRTQVSTRRRLQITIDVTILDDKGAILYDRRGLAASADYAERGEEDARHKAIAALVNDLVDGAQQQR
jgi:hypothetical protein